MGIDSTLYNIILLLHVLTAIVGFGGLIAHGAYNAKAFRATAGEALVLLRNTAAVTNIAHYAIYAMFVFGIVLISVSNGQISFGAPWVSASFLLVFVVIGLAHGLVRPAVRGLTARAEALPSGTTLESDPEAKALAGKLAIGEGVTQVLLAVALYLMVWQPGGLT